MDPLVFELTKGILAFVLPAVTALTAYGLWLRGRRLARSGSDRLIEELREENAQLRGELVSRFAELDERVDFVERRLVQEREPGRLPPPSVRTPV